MTVNAQSGVGMRKLRNRSIGIPLLFFACLGCETRSDGVGSGDLEEGPWWRLSSLPSVSIGGVSAEGPEALDQVRQGAVLSGGRIVLALRDEILLFSEKGAFLAYLGRRGEGPGEYRSIASMTRVWPTDTLLVLDRGNLRISTLAPGGETIRTELVDPGVFQVGLGSVVQPDGSILSTATNRLLAFRNGARHSELLEYSLDTLVLARIDGDEVDTLSVRDRGHRITSRVGNWTFAETPPLGRELLTALGSEIVAQGYNDTGDFVLLGLDGTEVGTVHSRARKRRVTDSIWRAASDEFLRRLGVFPVSGQTKETVLRDVLKNSEEPEFLPLVGQVFFDLQQNLWLRQDWDGGGPETIWEVHSKGGEFLAWIRMPSNLEPLEIGSTHILGVQRDSLDVESVVMFTLLQGH